MLEKAQKSEILWKDLVYFICKVGRDTHKMRSQCYDGDGNVSEKMKGSP